jgi:hypothetical protein
MAHADGFARKQKLAACHCLLLLGVLLKARETAKLLAGTLPDERTIIDMQRRDSQRLTGRQSARKGRLCGSSVKFFRSPQHSAAWLSL